MLGRSKTPPGPKSGKPKPPPNLGGPNLSLRRRSRSPLTPAPTSLDAREKIDQIVAVTRAPWGEKVAVIPAEKSADLERVLRDLEARLEEREHYNEELEVRLSEKERELAEMEAFLAAREQVLEAERLTAPKRTSLSQEEQQALAKLKSELGRQELSVKEQRVSIKEREQFLEDSEGQLFEKVQQQQETETELEQRAEDLKVRERRVMEREAKFDPAVAAKLEADKEKAANLDEFND
jgi:hypothetical protein